MTNSKKLRLRSFETAGNQ
jgi:myo-inositol 2-dehydrogenase/D-chiro-inositol 1-dehydrogenase